MEYLLALQVLCACFAAFIAARKGRSAIAWFLIGLLPVLGVVLAVVVKAPAEGQAGRGERQPVSQMPPRRCSGSYIPDCEGCPFFTKPLFDPSYQGAKKGYCKHFDRVLTEQDGSKGSRVTFKE